MKKEKEYAPEAVWIGWLFFWLATREGRDRVGESEDIFLKQIIKGTPKRS